MKRHWQRSSRTCPVCMSGYVTRSMCGGRECLRCGHTWMPSDFQGRPIYDRARLELFRRSEIEDPDERPYLWDLEDEGCH